MPDNPLARDHVALVTGGASGIGLGIAQALLDAGLRVVVTDVRADHFDRARTTLAAAADRVRFLELDVADPVQWSNARQCVEAEFGKLHILCLNAGVGVLGSMLDSGDADWEWLTAVNLGGVLLGLDAFLPHLLAHGEPAHIVATSSMGGLIVANDGGIYSTAKYGVVAAMEGLRRTLDGSNVGATVLCPAAVNTNIFDHARMRPALFAPGDSHDDQALAEAEAFAKRLLSFGRAPVEVGHMVRDAIARNTPYVFTDRNVRSTLLARRDALLAFAGEVA